MADLMLEGLLDSGTGEYVGDLNRRYYGVEAPGFPVTYDIAEDWPVIGPIDYWHCCILCRRRFRTRREMEEHVHRGETR